MTLLLGLDEITHAKTLEICLILKYSKSSTLHDTWHSLSPFFFLIFQSLSSFSFVSSCLHLLFPLLLLFTFFLLFFLHVIIYWFISTHPTRLLTLFHCDEYGKGQHKHLDRSWSSTFGNPSAWLMESRTAFSHTTAPFSAHTPLLSHAYPIWSSFSAENPLLLHIFVLKSPPDFVLNLSLVVWEQSFQG